jgi:hypothetical protein
LCTRTIWIDDGRIRMDGEPIEVVRAYEYEMHEAIARDQGRMVDQPVQSAKLEVTNEKPEPVAADPLPSRPDSSTTLAVDVETSKQSNSGEMKIAVIDGLHGISLAGQDKQCPSTELACASQLQPDRLPIGEAGAKPFGFTTGQYRILQIAFLDRNDTDIRIFRFGESLKLRVCYECLLPELPSYSCGLAVAFNRTSDFEAVMYFNTNYAHSDDELSHYFDAPFRKFMSRRGVIEAVIEPIQLRAGEYFVSLGILPNQPGIHEFYEYLHCQYKVTILANGFDEPAVFYPNVSWSHGPVDRE